jgi:hypothetical protein
MYIQNRRIAQSSFRENSLSLTSVDVFLKIQIIVKTFKIEVLFKEKCWKTIFVC